MQCHGISVYYGVEHVDPSFVETKISWTLHSELKLPRLGFVHPFRNGRCRTCKQQSLIQGTSRSTKETWQGRHAKHPCVFGASSFFGNLHNHNSNSLRKLLFFTSANEILDLICPDNSDSMGSHLVSCQVNLNPIPMWVMSFQ